MEKKIIETKQELHWHVISDCLLLLGKYPITNTDKTFKKLLNNLQDYVFEQISLENDGDVIDTYVTVLQESEE